MSKRRPDFQLTKNNFDAESDEDGQTINQPPKANLDVLKERAVLKAKPRMPSEQGSNSPVTFFGFKVPKTPTVFSSFASSTANKNNTNSGNTSFGKFNFDQSNVSSMFRSSMATTEVSTNFGDTFMPGSSAATLTTTIVKCDDNGNNSFGKPSADNKIEQSLTLAFKDTDKNNNNNAEVTFAANLIELNNVFFNHIKRYKDLSELYDFTNVCEQYVIHYKKIEDEKSKDQRRFY